MISTIILTKNEEKDISACLESLTWCDDIHVVDSGSSDKTLEICKKTNAKIHLNPFLSFAQQRNWSIDNCNTKYDWILFLDADERSTPAFKKSLFNKIKDASKEIAGFFCCWKMLLNNKWLKRSDSFPKWQLRILKKGKVRFIDFGHGQKEGKISGKLDYIAEPYEHYAFSKGWTDWVSKHNKYSTQEAIERLNSQQKLIEIFKASPSKRNMILKHTLTKIPAWPLIRFIYSYFIKLGFLEGKEGLIHCLNMFFYEYLILIKYSELKQK
jgi:glycosyltransferase involved in cell wall biosynthesis